MTSTFESEAKAPLAKIVRNHPDTASIHPATARRWATIGAKLSDGTVVKLESRRVGCRLASSAPALLRFLATLNGSPPAQFTEPSGRSKAERKRDDARASRKLKLAGC